MLEAQARLDLRADDGVFDLGAATELAFRERDGVGVMYAMVDSAAGQTAVLRVGDGNTPNATGAYSWVPFTDWNGAALPGALTITDPP